jgi:hypothetical protein
MACYVISNDAHIASSEYKFGYTDNTDKEKLLKRYNTQLNSPKILLFYYTPNAKDDETSVLVYFKDFRCKNSKGNHNEWLKIDFGILKEYLDKYFSKEEYADFRNMNLKQIELKVEALRLKVISMQIKSIDKEWRNIVSKALKDEDYLLELLNLYAKPDSTIEIKYFYEKYQVLNKIYINYKKNINEKNIKTQMLELFKKEWDTEKNISINLDNIRILDNIKTKNIDNEIEKHIYTIMMAVNEKIYFYILKSFCILYTSKGWIKYTLTLLHDFIKIAAFSIIVNNIFTEENIYNLDTIEVIIKLNEWYSDNEDVILCKDSKIMLYHDNKKCIELLLKE